MPAKRVGMTKAQTDDFLRGFRLMDAFGAAEPIVIGGVTFDLACDIDGSLWRPVTTIGSYDRATKQFAPRIAFPWTPTAVVDHWRSQGEVVDAPAGSVIKVAHLRSLPMYPTFQDLDAEEHRERKVAYLWVFQPDGELKLAEPPLMLLAETATIAHAEIGNYTRAYAGLVAKLERLMETEDLEDRLSGDKSEWPRPPESLSMTHRRALLALHEAVNDHEEQAYAVFGYLMGRAEAEQQLLQLALREHQAAQNRAKGGSVRRSKSRARTEPLRDQAKVLIRQNRNISLTACSKAVAVFILAEPGWGMGSDVNWISDQIRELFERRDIGGKVEYRPRDEWTQ